MTGGIVQVRDTKLGEASPILPFASGQWASFTTAIEEGRFDR
ncbi:MAG: hypothetical protein WCA46_07540 [Actinocatenispora sp.]